MGTQHATRIDQRSAPELDPLSPRRPCRRHRLYVQRSLCRAPRQPQHHRYRGLAAPGFALLSPGADRPGDGPPTLGVGWLERRGARGGGDGGPRPVVPLCGDDVGLVRSVPGLSPSARGLAFGASAPGQADPCRGDRLWPGGSGLDSGLRSDPLHRARRDGL